MRNIIGPKFSSDRFMWHPVKDELGGGDFSADMSQFNGQRSPLSQLWNDSCDAGFVMVSEKTGNEVMFTLVESKRDADGDMICWVFVPVTSSVRKYPRVQHVLVKIWNT